MSKARDLADFISTGSILSDGTIESTEISGVTADATEINKLDGLTADTTELNTLDGVTATTAELNKLAGTTATTSDFDKLSNVTASATELNYMTGATSSIQSQLDNISVTSGSLTKSFASGESATITLAQSITPAPVVSVTKEVAQTGQSSKGAWDVNATASNYDLHNTAYATTLTPGQTANTNISDATYANKSFSTTTQDATPKAAFFKTDGTVMYVIGYNADYVSQYTLSTAWDVSTATYANKNFYVGLLDAGPTALYITDDGLTGFFTGIVNKDIRKFTMSTAWDISTASDASNTLNVNTQETSPRGIWFKPDGTKLYMVGGNSYAVFEYGLSTAWDLTTASVTTSHSVGVQDNSPRGVTFNSTGTKMYVAGGTNSDIFQYTLSTAWDVSSASYDSVSLDITPQDVGLSDVFIGDNGTKIYATGDSNGAIYQYDNGTAALVLGTGSFASTDVGKRIQGNGGDVILTSTAGAYDTTGGSAFTDSSTIASGSWTMHGLKSAGASSGLTIPSINKSYSLNSASYDNTKRSLASAGSDLRDLFISPDGQYVFVVDTINNLRRFTLATPYDITSGGSYNQTFGIGSMSGITSYSQAFTFSSDGTQFFALDTNANLARTYFSTPWDLSTGINQSGDSLLSMISSTPLGLDVSSDGRTFYMCNANGTIQTRTYQNAYNIGNSNGAVNRTFTKGNEGGVGASRFEGIRVSSDGTKAFVALYDTQDVLRYDMTTAHDISTMSYSNEILDISGETDYPTGLSFIGATQGSKIVTLSRLDAVGTAEARIYQYSMGSVTVPTSQYHIGVTNASGQIDSSFWTDINSMTADQSLGDGEAYYAVSTDDRTTWSVAKGSDGVRPIVRDNAGTWQYNNDGGTISNYQLTSPTYVQNKFIGTTNVYGLFMKPDGTRLYYMQYTGNLYQWNLSTAYDVSTATFSTSISSPFSGLANHGTDLFFSSDGTKFFTTSIGTNNVNRFVLSTAWDLSSASFDYQQAINETASGLPGGLQGVDFKPDGTVMYLADTANVGQFNLSTAWDITSGASGSFPDNKINITNLSSSVQGVRFKSDGTEFYILDASGGDVLIYTMTTAWDISTATYSSKYTNPQSITTSRGIALSSDGIKMYIADEAGSARTYEYTIGSSVYSTSTTWVNGTTNDELYTLQEALGAQSHNRMDKTQLDAVADGSHFTLGNTLDLMIALKLDTASASLPTSDGVTINYDAEALNQGAVLGTDYDFDFPANNKVRITSNAAQNLKIRVV